ncbi:glutathione-disulfide reductase [Luteimonas salinilitoris]|uniref:Glutathione-disulfide reductase n=1 Tax=Luteimonas salinilitoris TaxID=3237697 RepID=A0ABV4HQM2_9GAMM
MSATDPFDFDLVVLGGGSGGLAGAFRAAEYGARVALLEPGELGGTCVNVGCVPKKAMWLAADLASRIAAAAQLGFDVPATPAFDWREFITDRQRYIGGIHESYRKRLDRAGIVLMPTLGSLRDAQTVVTGNGQCLRARHILLATGSSPQRPDVPGAELGGVSDDFFHWSQAPARVALVGGGYISAELAGLLQALGSRVDLFVRGTRLLSHADEEVVAQLEDNYCHLGIRLHFGHRLRAVEPAGDGRVRLLDEDGGASDAFDALLFAIGRRANSAGFGPDAAGVAIDARGNVQVDAFQNTSAVGVYAVGDVTGRETLTPVAIAAARRLMDRIFGGQAEARLDYGNVPTVIFAHPPIGGVGLTEAQARQRYGDAVKVYRSRFRPMLQALVEAPLCSLFKLVCVGEDERVVGVHLCGEAADEILQGFAVALKLGATMADLRDTVAIHPTSAEEVVLMR